jgi:phosphoglycerate dehydrogenase-like enzyme
LLVSKELKNLIVDVIGFGNIGSRVAEILRNRFKAKVLVYDPYVPPEKVKSLGCESVKKLEDLLKQSNIITLHAILTPETYHMINEKAFEVIKDGVIIVNIAREANRYTGAYKVHWKGKGCSSSFGRC